MLDFRGLIESALRALEEERPGDAEKGLRSALAMSPRDDQLLHLLGVSLIRQQREEEAIEPLKKAISLNRRDAEYHNALGCALRNSGSYAEGLESFQRALKLDPALSDAHFNLALTYQRLADYGRAEEKFRDLLARSPQDVEVLGGLAKLRWFLRDFEGALELLREGIRRVPQAGDLRFILGEHLLALERYEEGWYHYLWRVNRHVFFRKIGVPFNSAPLATPFEDSMSGRHIQLHAEQGIGDDLFFLRFAAYLRQRGARVSALVTPRLLPMIARSGIVDECGPAAERIPPDARYTMLADLPYLLQAHRLPVPPAVRFAPLPGRVAEMRALLEGKPRPLVGLTWRAGTGPDVGNRNALFKEVPFPKFTALAASLPGTPVILKREPKADELQAIRAACGGRLLDLSALNADLEGMLALLPLLDEYVGVSNTNMHLLAALGRTARVLVSGDVEFRWLAQGVQSPWFPGFPVHRQASTGDWGSALQAIAVEICATH